MTGAAPPQPAHPRPTTAWPDLAGRIVEAPDGRRHVLPVRVYFEDTDFSGLVYHVSYLRWCERGRSDFLRLLGVHHTMLIAGAGATGSPTEPAAFVVRRMSLEYLGPARIDEVLEVETRAGGRDAGPASGGAPRRPNTVHGRRDGGPGRPIG